MGSIHRHLMLRLGLALLAGGVLLGVATYLFTRSEMNEVFDEQLAQLATSVRTHYRGDVSTLPPKPAPEDSADLDDSGLVTQIWTLDRRQVFLSFPAATIPWVDGEGYQTVATPQGDWRIYAERTPTHLIQAAQLMATREDLAIDTAVEILLPNLLAVIALTALLLGVALRRGLLPLAKTSEDVGRRSASSLAPIATESLPDELKPLVASINALMARLSTALSAQRQFTADAAHELRTPLTALRLQVQLLASAPDEAARQEALDDVQRGLDRATHLVAQLLHLARLDPDASERASEAVDMAALVRSVVAECSVLAEARGIDLGAAVAPMAPDAALLQGDPAHLRMLLDNLVSNALRYTPRGGTVNVELRSEGATLILEVADSGPGIAAEDQARVFDRFYRGANVNAIDGAGTGSGLGLAIVKEVAEQHSARVELGAGLPGAEGASGLAVRVIFGDPGTP